MWKWEEIKVNPFIPPFLSYALGYHFYPALNKNTNK